MAYTSILAVHRLERSVEYVTNKDKTVRPRPDSASSLQEAVDYTRNREKTPDRAGIGGKAALREISRRHCDAS